jgi:5-methyltetrahydrofolate--homocysteine methyltransferase
LYLFGASRHYRSAGFQTCCIADFQFGSASGVVRSAGLETRDTADLEVCATLTDINFPDHPGAVDCWNVNAELNTTQDLERLLRERIVILDGPRGTMLQALKLTEQDVRGELFRDHPDDLKQDYDIVSLTGPEIVFDIHRQFIEAGADIIGTNTFTANRISQAHYGMERCVAEMNCAAARIARRAADEFMARHPDRQIFVAGAMGPTNRMASFCPDVNRPDYRSVTFDQLAEAYHEQACCLIEGGVDLLLAETMFDSINAKACIFALEQLFEELGHRLPLMISLTISDASGRTLSGQTIEAFWNSVRHARPLSVGINCALGAAEIRTYLQELSAIADCCVSCHPNAGRPNVFGEYEQSPRDMAAILGGYAQKGWLNLVGGCCGSTPEHIRAIAEAVRGVPARGQSHVEPCLRLSGLEPLTIHNHTVHAHCGGESHGHAHESSKILSKP